MSISEKDFNNLRVGALIQNCDPRKNGEHAIVTKIVAGSFLDESFVEYKRAGAYRKARVRADRLHPPNCGRKSNGWQIVSFGPAQAPHPVQATDDAEIARAESEGMVPRHAAAYA